MNAKKYKSTAFSKGCAECHSYGSLQHVRKKGIYWLTLMTPGLGNIYPIKIIIYEKVRALSGRSNEWKEIETIHFKDIPLEQQTWWQERQARERQKGQKVPPVQKTNLNDFYTPPGQVPTPYSLEGMWNDHVQRLQEAGLSDTEIQAHKGTFYRALYALSGEMLHFTDKAESVLSNYHRAAFNELGLDVDPVVPVTPPPSLAAN